MRFVDGIQLWHRRPMTLLINPQKYKGRAAWHSDAITHCADVINDRVVLAPMHNGK